MNEIMIKYRGFTFELIKLKSGTKRFDGWKDTNTERFSKWSFRDVIDYVNDYYHRIKAMEKYYGGRNEHIHRRRSTL